ncbi:kinase-like protein [Fomitiporia mediterranea MF3/22]|uniref:kinase-like protein n=1 Tax=Fomitiporia mediterranea (strain MF3/22) TaxID=694068 RepID=UPI0004407928|nr:kinase-like protein [Fomitiporia mediterranea MF3/22]EJC99208.1 kinase-like protein [Fomitiporia mediterranea MF3/22]
MYLRDRKVADTIRSTQYNSGNALQGTLARLTDLDLTGRVQYDSTAMRANGGYCDVFVGVVAIQRHGYSSGTTGTAGKVKVAVKRMRVHVQKEREYDKVLAKELYVWSKLGHPNILPLRGFALEGAYPLVISDWMENGTLREYLRDHAECDVEPLIVKIASGVNYLHRQDVVHSDLKADNVLISNHGEPLICDFGMARMLSASLTLAATSSGGIKGSLRWMAYELLDFSNDSHHTKETDVWAFGMTVYEILTRELPYAHLKNDGLVMRAITERKLPSRPGAYSNWSPFLQSAWTICEECWISPPRNRIAMEGATDILYCSVTRTNTIDINTVSISSNCLLTWGSDKLAKVDLRLPHSLGFRFSDFQRMVLLTEKELQQSAVEPRQTQMRVCTEIRNRIKLLADIRPRSHEYVTVEDVLTGICDALNVPVDTEYWKFDSKSQSAIAAYRLRVEAIKTGGLLFWGDHAFS